MPPTRKCDCGHCVTCKARERFARWWDGLTPEERQAWAARKDQDARRAADRRRWERDREKRMAAARWRREERMLDPDYRAAVEDRRQRWRARNPEKVEAHLAVRAAKVSGKLKRQPCSVPGCLRDGVAHHDQGYTPDKHLQVQWLCHQHHKQEHQEMDLLNNLRLD